MNLFSHTINTLPVIGLLQSTGHGSAILASLDMFGEYQKPNKPLNLPCEQALYKRQNTEAIML